MSSSSELHVTKRNGSLEIVSFDKILNRIKQLCVQEPQLSNVNYTQLAIKVIDQIYDGISTKELDELTAQQCASQITDHIDFGHLASRIVVSNHHKNTEGSFMQVSTALYHFKDIHGDHHPIVNEHYYNTVVSHGEELETMIDYNRDFLIDYFGFKTLERAYLMKVNGVIIERPQDMWMRVAVAIHGDDLERVKETYDLMSQKYFTHATPTLFNAGTPRQQMSSCYLLAMENDSIKGIYNTLSDCAMISKWAGGIGLHIHNIRATGSHIRGTNGTSNGIVPMLRVFNNTARYVDQCVTEDTTIYTRQGPMKICDVVSNETMVYNTEGTLETIKNVLEHAYEGDILHIKTLHSLFDLTITGEHPVFAIQHQTKNINYSVIKNRLDKNIISMEWVDARDLTTDSMIGFKIPSFSVDDTTITQDDCYFYGLVLGDGCLQNNKTYGHITMNTNTKCKQIDFVCNYLDNKLIKYTRTDSDDRSVTRIRWTKSPNNPIKYSDVYNSQKEKRIHHKWLNLPLEKSKYIVKGLLHSDGNNGKELMFDTTSLDLLEGLRFILLRMGLLTSGYIRDRVGESHVTKYGSTITTQKISYVLRIPKSIEICELCEYDNPNKFYKFFRYQDYLFSRVQDINVGKFSGTLYDLQMETTHNYMIHNGIVHNGGGRRNGSFAMYIEPWHADIEDFLQMRKNHGDEEMKARDLFYALWIPDLFMKRVKENAQWTLMCPDKCPGLSNVYGDEFEQLYTKYESEGRGNKTVDARSIWFQMLDSQIETGTPYMLYKDAANKKSNQKNLGTIKSSNLCTEIIEYSDDKQTAVCNLASIGLSKFVEPVEHQLAKTVILYTKDDCNWCLLLKGLLNKHNIKYVEKTVTRETFDFYKQHHNYNTVPLLYSDGKQIGGYDAVNELLRPTFNFDKLHEVTKTVTRNLNRVIDLNYYPTEKTKRSNMYHRPIGIGVQGLADVFTMMNYPFDSPESKQLNRDIFETIYHAALERSNELAIERKEMMNHLKTQLGVSWKFKENNQDHERDYINLVEDDNITTLLNRYIPVEREITQLSSEYAGAYSSFDGSPASKGVLQFDMWDVAPSNRYDWNTLKHSIMTHGVRNSLLVAPMPTASTSQILGNNECFEPFTSNIYMRRTIAGQFVIMNKYLLEDLCSLGLWNKDVKNIIVATDGSIQNIEGIPQALKDKYRTVWEIPMKSLIEMARDRGAFICQSQSMNLWMKNPDYARLTAMHFFSWSQGLKTGLYYLRTTAKAAAQKFTIDPSLTGSNKKVQEDEDDGECLMCGS